MSRELPRRLLIAPALAVVIAGLLIVVGLSAARSELRTAGVAHQVHAVDRDACVAEPESWGWRSGRVSMFAYDRDGRSANPDAPPLEPSLLQGALAREEIVGESTPEHSVFVAPSADDGPCAVLRVSSPNVETVVRPRLLGVLGTALVGGMLLAAAGTFWLIVLPLRHRVEGLARAAKEVGNEGFASPPVTSDALGHIAEVLSRSHERIVVTHDKLEQRNLALENHLAGIAHDLRTPLSSMHLALEALAAESDGALRNEARRALADIVYLSSMVENLHQAARLRHEVDVASGTVDLADVVRRLEHRFAIVGRHAGVAVAANVPEEPVWVECRPALAERAVANLIQNAVEHNSEPGHVAITLEVAGDRAQWQLVVADDGPGLPEGTLARLEEATFLVEEARRRGPGLGMLITAEVARRVGWSVAYEGSEPTGLRVRLSGTCGEPP